jgi:hypothetical protein
LAFDPFAPSQRATHNGRFSGASFADRHTMNFELSRDRTIRGRRPAVAPDANAIQCAIPRVAAAALNLDVSLGAEHADRSPDVNREFGELSSHHAWTRISTSVPMATYLLERLRFLASSAEQRYDLTLLVACARAVAVLGRAISRAGRVSGLGVADSADAIRYPSGAFARDR